MKPTLDSRCRSFYSFLHRLNDGWFGATPKRKLRGTLAKDQGFLILTSLRHRRYCKVSHVWRKSAQHQTAWNERVIDFSPKQKLLQAQEPGLRQVRCGKSIQSNKIAKFLFSRQVGVEAWARLGSQLPYKNIHFKWHWIEICLFVEKSGNEQTKFIHFIRKLGALKYFFKKVSCTLIHTPRTPERKVPMETVNHCHMAHCAWK